MQYEIEEEFISIASTFVNYNEDSAEKVACDLLNYLKSRGFILSKEGNKIEKR